MWRRSIRVMGYVACAWTFGFAAQAHAYSLAELFAEPSLKLDLRDVRFTAFRDWQSGGYDGAAPLSADDIDVSLIEIDDAVGLRLASPTFTVRDGQTRRIAFAYDIHTTDPLSFITGSALEVEGASLSRGEFIITRHDIGHDSKGAEKLLAVAAVQGDSSVLVERDKSYFFPPQPRVAVRTELVLVSLPRGEARVEGFVHYVQRDETGEPHAMPEPGVATLGGIAGLTLLTTALRRRRLPRAVS